MVLELCCKGIDTIYVGAATYEGILGGDSL